MKILLFCRQLTAKGLTKILSNFEKNKMLISFVITIIFIVFINYPIDNAYFVNIGGQLVAAVLFTVFTILINEKKNWNAIRKSISFAAIATLSLLIWNLSVPVKEITCFTDIALFKTGSGNLLAPQVFAYSEDDFWPSRGELGGYYKLNEIDQNINYENKNNNLFDYLLIGTATFSWINENYFDWSGCEAQPVFTGLSAATQRVKCGESNGNKISLQDIFGSVGSNQEFYLPPHTKITTQSGTNTLLIKLENKYIEIDFLITKELQQILNPHKKDSKLASVEEKIARYYKKQPLPLTNHGYRTNFSLTTKLLRKWSKNTIAYQNWGILYCTNYERAFSWKNLRKMK
ncbi:hypothetical protein KJ652_07370 [Patescibacteria group bacterium]|nr:hypothetical protein [Patescibacteria group bacterium]